ncbi:MAG TPA: MATE family efflux transporter [Geminicoccaceae bacterium]|nr:MATE family efflux transporter [Geminicoccaceae bacterium]
MSAYREAWRLAWPLILSNLSIPLLGIVDTAVVGHLDAPHYLGAVALGAVALSVAYFLFGFLRMGTTGLTAQAFGRADHAECFGWLARGMLLAVAIAAVLGLLAAPLIDGAIRLFDPGARVEGELATYLAIRLVGAPAALLVMVVHGWLLGMQNARGPMLLLIVTNGINMALALLFVLGFGWAVAGVAWATVCAEYGGLALGLWLVRRPLRGGAWRAVWRAQAFRRLLVVNRDMFLRSFCLEAAFLTFSALGARQGEVILAANAVLFNLHLLASYGLDGFAHAAEAMVGRRVGAGDAPGLRAAFRANMAWALGLALLLGLAAALLGPAAIRGMTGIGTVRAAALTYLPWLIVAPLVSVWAFLFDGVFIGATRTAEMRNGMAASLLAFWLAAWLLLPRWGNHGLWLAFLLLMSARGLWLGVIWLHHKPEAWAPARR